VLNDASLKALTNYYHYERLQTMDNAKLMALMASKKAAMQKVEKTAKLKPGKNRIRLLPGWEKGREEVFFQDFGQHFIKDETDTIKAVYLCTSATHEQDCPVCNAIAQGIKNCGDDELAKVLEKGRPSRTVLINALLLDSEEPNTPQILEIKRSVFGQLIEIISEWGAEAVFDPTNGKEILINRDGKGLNTTYTAQITPKTAPYNVSVLAKLNNLADYVKQESDEQQRRAIGAVNGIAGLLPAAGAATAGAGAPRLTGKPKADFDDVPDLDMTETVDVKSAASAAPSLDTELDDLLSDLPE
jgi:hypothetical protein